MLRLRVLTFAALAAVPHVATADYTVDCEAYNSKTGAYVSGECSDGDFDGYNEETGAEVYGDCEFGGEVDGYDAETREYVYGECEGE